MLDILFFMAPAICMCVILVGVFGYVGIHVVMREVIFIDIALAQVAALGATFAVFFGFEISSVWGTIISLVSTLLAAWLLSYARSFSKKVPQEAFIGILYATCSAAVILAGDRLPHGAEYVHDLMVGHLLWTNWGEVALYLVIYSIFGVVYYFIHSKLMAISLLKRNGEGQVHNIALWDFIFYALLGVLVTFAVKVAGVLLVFGFLIVPAVIGSLLGTSFRVRLIIGWVSGILVSLIGSYLSYQLDFPTGATVVVTLGIGLFLAALFTKLRTRIA